MSEPDRAPLAVIVVAAGRAERFGGDKLFARLGGLPVLGWSLRALEAASLVSSVVVVLSESNLDRGRRLITRLGCRKVRAICLGGARRQDSVWNGLQETAGAEWVAIHDAARPFLTAELLARGLATAQQVGAAVAAVPVKDTIKLVAAANLIERTPNRSRLWAAQTPQIFQRAQLVEAYRHNAGAEATDEAQLLERAGLPVAVYHGSYENVKITTPEDLLLARGLARRGRVERGVGITRREALGEER